ncbi:MAG: HEPN domain-containing protein [Desulfamplus sp.]|nr:HEPN domain-containing protein [Desulfamplus sp.]
MNEKVKYWIEIAEYDLETARAMQKSSRFLYVGFMCHQVVEKILKGYYVFIKNETPPYTHNLTYLAEQSRIYEIMTETHKNTLDLLGPLNIQARYPTHKEKLFQSLNKERCDEIIIQTEEIYQWIKQQCENL